MGKRAKILPNAPMDVPVEMIDGKIEKREKKKKEKKPKNKDRSVVENCATEEHKKPNPVREIVPPVSEYRPGALSAALGLAKNSETVNDDSVGVIQSAGSNIEQPWLTASSVIPKKEKTEKTVTSTGASTGEAAGDGIDALDDANKSSRAQQRENRKKKNDGMSDEDKARTIFVGNVDVETEEKEVKKLFIQFGPVESIRMRGIIPANGKLTKKVAALANKLAEHQKTVIYYIKFKDAESVAKARELNGSEQWGHRLRVDGCVGKSGCDSKMSVFLGNVPFDATEDALTRHFESKIGPVSAVRLVRDKETGHGKGFAFVSFKDSASVALALSLPTIKYKKRELRVSKVLKKNKLKRLNGAKPIEGSKKPQRKDFGKLVKGKKGGFVGRKFGQKTVTDRREGPVHKSVRKAIRKRQSGGGPKSLMT